MPEDDSGKAKSGFLAFWTTLPGILTGVAAVVTAFVGLATFLRSTESAAVATTSHETRPAAPTTAPSGGGVLSHGRLSLRKGDEADLETGVIGTASGTDLSFGPESTPWLHAGADAFFAPVDAAPTRARCAAALTHRRDPFEELPSLGTRWICVSTTEGHVAAIEVMALPGVGNANLRLAYTVWN